MKMNSTILFSVFNLMSISTDAGKRKNWISKEYDISKFCSNNFYEFFHNFSAFKIIRPQVYELEVEAKSLVA